MIALVVLGIAAAFALATWTLGWWGVIVVALVAGATWRHRHAARLVAFGAVLGWGALLVADASAGRIAAFSTQLGGVFRVPGAVLLLVTVLFAALLAWSTAAVAQDLVRVVRRNSLPRAGP